MSWTSKNKPVKHKAKEDIKVFKIFRVHEYCNIVITSPIRNNCLWEKGEVHEVNKVEIGYSDQSEVWVISSGIHSLQEAPVRDKNSYGTLCWFSEKKKKRCAKKRFTLFPVDSYEEVLECIIPKGAIYYLNEHGCIVSNKLYVI